MIVHSSTSVRQLLITQAYGTCTIIAYYKSIPYSNTIETRVLTNNRKLKVAKTMLAKHPSEILTCETKKLKTQARLLLAHTSRTSQQQHVRLINSKA